MDLFFWPKSWHLFSCSSQNFGQLLVQNTWHLFSCPKLLEFFSCPKLPKFPFILMPKILGNYFHTKFLGNYFHDAQKFPGNYFHAQNAFNLFACPAQRTILTFVNKRMYLSVPTCLTTIIRVRYSLPTFIRNKNGNNRSKNLYACRRKPDHATGSTIVKYSFVVHTYTHISLIIRTFIPFQRKKSVHFHLSQCEH